MKNKLWTKEEEDLIRDLSNKMSFKEMEKHIIGRAADSIKVRASKLKIKNNFVHKKYNKNESFWETPSPINCYWAGFIAADGCINENKNFLAIEISIMDIAHLEKFKEQTGFTGKITQRQVRYSGDENSPTTTAVALRIHSCEKWINDMKKNFNLCQNKTRVLRGPNLDDDYLKLCFLLGFLDGDGCLCWVKDKKEGYPLIKFTSSSLSILNWIKEFMDKHFKVSFLKIDPKNSIKPYKNHLIYKIIGLRAAKFFEFASEIDVPKLDRKWKNEKVIYGMKEYKIRRPEFFTKNMAYNIDNYAIVSPDFKDICLYNLSHMADRMNGKKLTLSGQ